MPLPAIQPPTFCQLICDKPCSLWNNKWVTKGERKEKKRRRTAWLVETVYFLSPFLLFIWAHFLPPSLRPIPHSLWVLSYQIREWGSVFEPREVFFMFKGPDNEAHCSAFLLSFLAISTELHKSKQGHVTPILCNIDVASHIGPFLAQRAVLIRNTTSLISFALSLEAVHSPKHKI